MDNSIHIGHSDNWENIRVCARHSTIFATRTMHWTYSPLETCKDWIKKTYPCGTMAFIRQHSQREQKSKKEKMQELAYGGILGEKTFQNPEFSRTPSAPYHPIILQRRWRLTERSLLQLRILVNRWREFCPNQRFEHSETSEDDNREKSVWEYGTLDTGTSSERNHGIFG